MGKSLKNHFEFFSNSAFSHFCMVFVTFAQYLKTYDIYLNNFNCYELARHEANIQYKTFCWNIVLNSAL
jgi:hypothetical protein